MKKFFRQLTVVALSLVCLAGYAHDFEVDGIYYNNTAYGEVGVTYRGSDNGEYVNEYTGKVVIPSTVTYNDKTLKVTSVCSEAFMGCTELTDVVFPAELVSIDSEAFSGCKGLVSIDIPESVTAIHTKAFWQCTQLALVTIPRSVTYIGRSAFGQTPFYVNRAEGIVYLGSVLYDYKGAVPQDMRIDVPDYIVSITDNAFQNKVGLAAITFPEGLQGIGHSAFDGCTGLTEITIPRGITSLATYAFKGCKNVETVYYNAVNCGNGIGDDIFKSCVSLQEVKIGDAVEEIPYRLFYECNSIACVSMGSSVTVIRSDAFRGTSLTSVSLPESLVEIENGAFAGTALTEITIPRNVAIVGTAFSSCDKLATLNFNAENCTEWAMNNTIETLNIGSGVKVLPEKLVANCAKLRQVVVPEGVTEIGFRAFYNCTNLQKVSLPSTVTAIGNGAFYNATNIAEIEIMAVTPPVVKSNTFENVTKTIPLYVPKGSKEAYAAAEYWSEFTNIIEMEVLPTSIVLDCHELSMYVAQQTQLNVVILPENATTPTLSWTSSDDAIATVDNRGVVTAHRVGSVVITVATTDGSNLSDACVVTVEPILAETLTLDKESIVAIVGDVITLTATINPQEATEQSVLWEVSDDMVVDMTVLTDNSVQLVILREGIATITARTIDGSELVATCNINVLSGMTNVTTDSENIEYYDLNGYRVSHPQHGVYIEKHGNTVRKVVL